MEGVNDVGAMRGVIGVGIATMDVVTKVEAMEGVTRVGGNYTFYNDNYMIICICITDVMSSIYRYFLIYAYEFWSYVYAYMRI